MNEKKTRRNEWEALMSRPAPQSWALRRREWPGSGGEAPACPIKALDPQEIPEWNRHSRLPPTLTGRCCTVLHQEERKRVCSGVFTCQLTSGSREFSSRKTRRGWHTSLLDASLPNFKCENEATGNGTGRRMDTDQGPTCRPGGSWWGRWQSPQQRERLRGKLALMPPPCLWLPFFWFWFYLTTVHLKSRAFFKQC